MGDVTADALASMKLVDPEAVPAAILEDADALALHVLAARRNSEIGDGFHGSVYGNRRL